jgi:hypothetical protein
MSLTTHHLAFRGEAQTPIVLDDQAGSAIRGALVGALWERFCVNKALPTCAGCPLIQACPVSELIAPMREAGETGGEQRPRPYVTRPPAGHSYIPGEPLDFGLVLIGPAARLFPYLVMAAQDIEQQGLGRRLPQLGGQRGRIALTTIAALNPLTGAQQPLYQRGNRQVHMPDCSVTAAHVRSFAQSLPNNQITLTLATPLRLIDDGHLVHRFDPLPFFKRLAWRLDELGRAYGSGPLSSGPDLVAHAAATIQVLHNETRWVDVVSFSSRTRQRTPIGGLVGTLTLIGDLAPLLELLVWGSLVHVGKNAVKGDGWYQITA